MSPDLASRERRRLARAGNLAAAFILAIVLHVFSADRAKAEDPDLCPGNPDALGTSRILPVGGKDTRPVGLKTYRQTLALADHEVVLTFDDGPSPGTTTRILDALADECVQATFFLIGRNVDAAPSIVRREVAEGHTVAHHSWSHPAVTLRGLSDAAARLDIDRGIASVERAAYGIEPTGTAAQPRVPFFRFPGFADTKPLLDWLAQRHITVFGTDLWASDWTPMAPDQELALIVSRLERARSGILLFHDTREQTAIMVPQLLRQLKYRGFRVVHVVPGEDSAALRDAPAEWSSTTEEILARIWPKKIGKNPHDTSSTHAPHRTEIQPGLVRSASHRGPARRFQ